MPFYPGPGMGGHCLPDPFYLDLAVRASSTSATEFIELAGKVNAQMPYFCVERIERALNDVYKPVRGAEASCSWAFSYKPGVGRPARLTDPGGSSRCYRARRRRLLLRPVRRLGLPSYDLVGAVDLAAALEGSGHRRDRHRPPRRRPRQRRGCAAGHRRLPRRDAAFEARGGPGPGLTDRTSPALAASIATCAPSPIDILTALGRSKRRTMLAPRPMMLVSSRLPTNSSCAASITIECSISVPSMRTSAPIEVYGPT